MRLKENSWIAIIYPTFCFWGKKEGSLELMEGTLMKGETTIYVCKNKACRLPVSQVEDVLKQLKE